ncbi:hypothetical protein Mapa_001013 [Marchantia paleacea]|nr:hypothetical protein Mapa_001013 [Marchantia paleacea]
MATGAHRIAYSRYLGPEFATSTSSYLPSSFPPQRRFARVKASHRMLGVEKLYLGRVSSPIGDAFLKPFQTSRAKARASKDEESSGSSSKDGGKSRDDESGEAGGVDSETDEDEEIREIRDEIQSELNPEKATAASSQQVSKRNSGFWGNWWGRVRRQIDDAAEEEAEGPSNNGDDGSDSEDDDDDDEGDSVRVKQEEEELVNPVEEDAPTAEPAKAGLWSRLWRRGADTTAAADVDPETSLDDELLLRDLENLQFRWKELLEPSVENVLALALTAVLAFAGVQIVWQMVVVATAITLSALKYTVLAAIIVGLLIFLL